MISLDEMKKGFELFKQKADFDLEESEIINLFNSMDFDDSGSIDYSGKNN